ncbi:MAG: carboxyl transferase [Lachnospiraceae bacterium]|nr:carboxyl transferase [Lachnospiraceae bacterium]
MSNTAESSARKRIASVLDENSFVEIGGYVTARNTDFNLQTKDTPADGVVTGYGTIGETLVYVYSQDSTVLGGSIGEMHAKKIEKLYDMALKMGAPVIGLVDCAGLRLQEATDALQAFGSLFMSQVKASGVIPQITAIYGVCGGGMALVPSLTDFTFMEGKNGKLFVNSPNAIEGNYTEKCDTSSAKFQSEEAGLVDVIGTEDEIAASIRELISILPANNEDDFSYEECRDSLNREVPSAAAYAADTASLAALISDDQYFFETKAAFAKEMVTGFIRLNGRTVGVVANRSEKFDENGESVWKEDAVLTVAGAKKAASFVSFCDAFEIPLLTFTNVTGFCACKCAEKNMSLAAAKLTYAFASATVPKINVITGDAYGSAYLTMNSKSTGADIVYAWPTASIGMMDAAQAVRIIYADEISAADSAASMISEKTAEYQALQSSALAAAKRGYVDDIIDASETRKRVIAAFEMLFTKREIPAVQKKHGTVY